jgi:hypothetical protein
MSLIIRITAAVVLTLGIVSALAQSASAASGTRRHHPVTTGQTIKPSEQYLRSASPDPEHAQR